MEPHNPPIVGLDLAGSECRPSGFAVLRAQEISMAELYGNAEVIAAIRESQAWLVMVDAPLSLPAGRHCMEDGCPCGKELHFRQCDRELRRLGIKFFPITLGPMRVLTRRGLRLKAELEHTGIRVVETYPGAAQDLWRIPRQKDARGLQAGLQRLLGTYQLKADLSRKSVHELDAVTCALVGWLYAQKRFQALGDPAEGLMILPEGDN